MVVFARSPTQLESMRWHEKVSSWHHFRLLVIESSTRPNRRGLTETEAEKGFGACQKPTRRKSRGYRTGLLEGVTLLPEGELHQ
jgi:hypothetical protein